MTTQRLAQGARSASQLNLGTLASATYVASSSIDLADGNGNIPLDVTLEAVCDPNGTPTGNKQLVVFVKCSLDNTNFGSGPESGTDATQEADLHFVGVLPCNDTNAHTKFFSLQGLPVARYIKIIAKNDMGVALTSGNIYRADISGDSR